MRNDNFLLLISGASACFDLVRARIPNAFLLPCALFCVAMRVVSEGAAGLFSAAAGFFLPVLLLAVFYYFRMIGGGDIKLLATLGILTGPGDILFVMFWSFSVAAVFAVGILSANHNFRERFAGLTVYVREMLRTGKKKPYRIPVAEERKKDREGRTKSGAVSCRGVIRSASELHFAVPVLIAVISYVASHLL
ncbi:MAG: A24 family peptidase [Bilifractor sp.]|jgi:Flp pilus assembly protein protease CpaA